MKPRAFIGSSVEGLNIAYAVQQNLLHDAEITVWDQGVFELSSTTIESLVKVLATNDFGVFVFSADDLVKIRGKEGASVRDNVLFEFGLFIGKLGRERVFFLIPDGSELHIPSDLIGITAGKYESNRLDGSMQAATGPASHQIRLQIKKLGALQTRLATGSEDTIVQVAEGTTWATDFFQKKFESAKVKIEAEMAKSTDIDKSPLLELCLRYCEFKTDFKQGIKPLLEYAESQPDSLKMKRWTAALLKMDGRFPDAINLLKDIKKQYQHDHSIDLAIAKCHAENEEHEIAISILETANPSINPDVALTLVDLLEKQEKVAEALDVISRCYGADSSVEHVRFKYARLAQDLNFHEIAVYLLDKLTSDFPDSIEYWGYLGNTCLSLDLMDVSLTAYRRAEQLMKPDESSPWIVSNIGNLFSNVGLSSEACAYLERALTKEPKSEYAHDRLASALKNVQEKRKVYQSKCSEGFRQIRDSLRTDNLPS
ncbi:MAG: TIR domain-containing protein [Prosthecobacter sp.]|uniref:TIR domain-containing protein n=1 Tax=Prosthecobacter sp. TaxID=1965333 RepID=UPI003902BAAF